MRSDMWLRHIMVSKLQSQQGRSPEYCRASRGTALNTAEPAGAQP